MLQQTADFFKDRYGAKAKTKEESCETNYDCIETTFCCSTAACSSPNVCLHG